MGTLEQMDPEDTTFRLGREMMVDISQWKNNSVSHQQATVSGFFFSTFLIISRFTFWGNFPSAPDEAKSAQGPLNLYPW